MIKAIIYDCVGPILIKDPTAPRFDKITEKIDRLCGSAVDEKTFWENISKKFKLNKKSLQKIITVIADQRALNKPLWDFHRQTKNKYKTAIINNGTLTIFNKWVRKFHFKNNFDALFNSAEKGLAKPDPRIFKMACKELGVKLTQAILIDDTKENIRGAKTIGMKGFLYDHKKHRDFLNSVQDLLA